MKFDTSFLAVLLPVLVWFLLGLCAFMNPRLKRSSIYCYCQDRFMFLEDECVINGNMKFSAHFLRLVTFEECQLYVREEFH